MGLLDDAIREHLDLMRRRGADPEEVSRREQEALGPSRRGEFVSTSGEPDDGERYDYASEPEAPPDTQQPAAVAAPPSDASVEPDDEEPWLDEPDEVPVEERLDHDEPDYVEPDEEAPRGEDVLDQTPEFLQETPEHDRLWFEQRPPRDFDFDK